MNELEEKVARYEKALKAIIEESYFDCFYTGDHHRIAEMALKGLSFKQYEDLNMRRERLHDTYNK